MLKCKKIIIYRKLHETVFFPINYLDCGSRFGLICPDSFIMNPKKIYPPHDSIKDLT